MQRVFLTALSIVVVFMSNQAAFAGEQFFVDRAGQPTEFMAPSGNIGCIYIPKGGTDVYEPEDGGPELQCDRVEPVYQRFILNKVGKAKKITNVGDASCCSSGDVLKYGNSTTLGPFTCLSATTGLTCTRGKSGFFISKRKTQVW